MKKKPNNKVGTVASNVVKKHNFNASKKAATKKSNKSSKNFNPNENFKKGKKNKKGGRIKKFFLVCFLLFVLVALVAIGIFCGIFFSDKFALSKEDLLLSKANTIVYDKDGNVIAELSGDENREIISFSDMSQYLPKAFVSIEDERFYSHSGVDWKRTLAATGTYVTKGESSYGGSTITQQLVKNVTNERDNSGQAGVERKIKEMSRAYQVEKMISKDQILELYLNIIPLAAEGGDICGVEMASTYYFNKSASELSIEESAFLAGINHAPNMYNPFKNAENEQAQAETLEKIRKRTETVLQKMRSLGNITEEEYQTAHNNLNAGLKFEKGNLPSSRVESYFIQAAIEEVIKDLVTDKGLSEEYAKSRVYGGGYKIYTTMSAKVQADLEEVYKSDDFNLTSWKTEEHSQSAMVIMDYTTGQVVGCMGGLGSDVNAIGINRATSITRQPGSSFKPIVTYGCGIEKGIITAGTVYDNSRTTFGTNWSPASTGYYSGLCTIRNAIEVSSNTVAAKIMSEIGPDNAIDFARECGITSLIKSSEDGAYNDSNLPSMALGGLTKGVSPLQMAAAYSMIGNNGVYISPVFYTKVVDSSDEVVIEPKQTTRRVMSEQNAYIMKTLLRQPVEGAHGTATNCGIDGIDVGAKTGTTDKEYDKWLCGITPYYAAATWYGYDKNQVEVNGSGNYAAKVWIAVMRKVHEDLPSATFTEPAGITQVRICRRTGCKATSLCSDTYLEYYAEDAIPEDCNGHSSLKICSESGLLATDNCPSTYYLSYVPEKERDPSWKTSSSQNFNAPSETCTIHATPTASNNDNNNSTNTTVGNYIVISSDVVVPSVIGKSEADARSSLSGLSVEVTYKSDSTKSTGVVLSQSLSSGKVVSKNTTIRLTVNKVETTPTETKPVKPEQTDNSIDADVTIN